MSEVYHDEPPEASADTLAASDAAAEEYSAMLAGDESRAAAEAQARDRGGHAMSATPKSSAVKKQFERINAFIRNGWHAKLTKLESGVWLAYWNHAQGETGLSKPGPRLVARYVGHSGAGHVRAARSTLCRLGLLKATDDRRGGSPYAPGEFIVLTPPTLPRSGIASEATDPTPPVARLPYPESERYPTPNRSATLPRQRRTVEQSLEQSSSTIQQQQSAVAADDESEAEKARIDAVRESLRAHGVGGEKIIRELSSIAGITAAVVNEIERGIKGDPENPAGLLVKLIREDAPAQIAKHRDKVKAEILARAEDAERLEAERDGRTARINAALADAAGRIKVDAALQAGAAALNGNREELALIRLRGIIGKDVQATDIAGAEPAALDALAVEYLRMKRRKEAVERERRAVSDSVDRQRAEHDAKVKADAAAAAQAIIDARENFRREHAGEWPALEAAYASRWPADYRLLVKCPDKLADAILDAVASHKLAIAVGGTA